MLRPEVRESLAESLSLVVEAGQLVVRALGHLLTSNAGSLRRLAEGVQRLQDGPPVAGYEPLLVAELGCRPETRILARAIHFFGEARKREQEAARALASALTVVVGARGKTTLVVSRRAIELRDQLVDQSTRLALERACCRAGRPELASELSDILDKAAQRDPEACEMLLSQAALLLGVLPTPRGRPIDSATTKHELLLECLEQMGRPRSFTRNAYVDDFTDPATQATRLATGTPAFDPRYASRRLKRRPSETS